MTKSPDAFRTISEVADWLGIQAHVLRFWESKFAQVKPVKRAGGRRYYRPSDMVLIGGIKKLLHDDGLTIKGVQKILREHGVAHVSSLSQSLDETAPPIQHGAVVDAQNVPDDTADDTDDTVVSFSDALRVAETPPPAQIDLDLAPPPPEPDPVDAPQSAELLPDLEVDQEATEDRPVPDAETEAAAPDSHPDEEPEPKAPSPALTIPRVEAADPPPHAQIEFTPGPLSHLYSVTSLDGQNIADLTEIATALDGLGQSKNNVTAE
ncbi:MerR family transcriptional regulator [Aliisedimentitalea scapharcae]|uniref:MerR family transcriptional regulator n=1 Tax=Aliisedimentitalea scapharcae TaxID=1524259 RepID=A0ABZ2XQB8_9RHOB